MKLKILGVCAIAAQFAMCGEVNNELIKDIQTDGKGGYYIMHPNDCTNLKKAGILKNEADYDRCFKYPSKNLMLKAYQAGRDKVVLEAFYPSR